MADMIKESEDEDRRKFLATCGRFAIVTPPVMTMLLSTSLTSKAIASSSGGSWHYRDGGGGDYHHHDNDGSDYHHDEGHHNGWWRRGERD
jgi:hypothetical protein